MQGFQQVTNTSETEAGIESGRELLQPDSSKEAHLKINDHTL